MPKNEYMTRNKYNELHYEKLKDDELIQLTHLMTSRCFLMRPACSDCDLSGDSIYCPPAAAHKVLIENRGYGLVEIPNGLLSKKIYTQNIYNFMEIGCI